LQNNYNDNNFNPLSNIINNRLGTANTLNSPNKKYKNDTEINIDSNPYCNINNLNTNRKQKSKKNSISYSNSLNLNNNIKDSLNTKKNLEEILDTSTIINKLFASKKDSIDFSMNSFKIEKDFVVTNTNSINNLNYVNKGGKISVGNSSKQKSKEITNTKSNITLTNNENKVNSINPSNPSKSNFNSNNGITKNLTSGIIKKPKTEDLLFDRLEKNNLINEKEDLKSKLHPYTSGFNSKIFGSSNYNNSKSTNSLLKKDKHKNENNILNTQQQLGLKNETSFSPLNKIGKDYSENNFDELRKYSQEKNTVREASSKDKNLLNDKKNNFTNKNKAKEIISGNKTTTVNNNKNQKDKLKEEEINFNNKLSKNMTCDVQNSKNESRRASIIDEKYNDKIIIKPSRDSNLFSFAFNLNTEARPILKKEKSNNAILGKTKSKCVMINLDNNKDDALIINKQNDKKEKEKEIDLKTTELSNNFNNFPISPDRDSKKTIQSNNKSKDNYNNAKITTSNLNNKLNNQNQELIFLKSETKNFTGASNKEITNLKSKLIANTIISNTNNDPYINNYIEKNKINTIDVQDNNPELKIYKSNKIKRVLKKEENNKINNNVSNKNNLNFTKNKDNTYSCKELEEQEVLLDRSCTEEIKEFNQYTILNSMNEKLVKRNCNDNSNKDEFSMKNKSASFDLNNNFTFLKDINANIVGSNKFIENKPIANFSITNHPNYQKLKEYSNLKENVYLCENNLESKSKRYNKKKSEDSTSYLKYYELDNLQKKDLNNDINNLADAKTIIDLESNFKFIEKINTSTNRNIYNFERGSSQISLEIRSKKLSDAREKKFSNRLSTENPISLASNYSNEKNSDFKKLSQKLNDVCHNLALFRVKSDYLKEKDVIHKEKNSDIGYKKKESSDYEFNFRRNFNNTENNNENMNMILNKKEKLNALRSSDPINYTKKINLDTKFVKQAILSHR